MFGSGVDAMSILSVHFLMILPWIGLSILTPASFVGNLILNLLMFNFPGAWWLIMKEGIPALLTTYLITVVYTLYLHMLTKTNDVIEASSSVVGSTPCDSPPSYDSLVQAHKQHIST
jgi:hypothetical protein